MQLVLSVVGKVLDRIQIKPDLSNDSEYITAMQRLLLVKHELTLLAYLQEPIFYIETPSQMNNKKPL